MDIWTKLLRQCFPSGKKLQHIQTRCIATIWTTFLPSGMLCSNDYISILALYLPYVQGLLAITNSNGIITCVCSVHYDIRALYMWCEGKISLIAGQRNIRSVKTIFDLNYNMGNRDHKKRKETMMYCNTIQHVAIDANKTKETRIKQVSKLYSTNAC